MSGCGIVKRMSSSSAPLPPFPSAFPPSPGSPPPAATTATTATTARFIHKSHNVSLLIYHAVCPAKYRRAVFDEAAVAAVLRDVCLEIADRYEINFLEIGIDRDHVHFLVQSVPDNSPTKIIRTIKSITAREIFARVPSIKTQLWGGAFWSSGFYMDTVGRHGGLDVISRYVKEQGTEHEYQKLHEGQLALFWPQSSS